MSAGPDKSGKFGLSFAHYLWLYTILVIIVAISCISIVSFLSASEKIDRTIQAEQNITEHSIVLLVQLGDISQKLNDNFLEGQMQKSFVPFLEEYDLMGGDISRMDLHKIQEKIGNQVDLYIFNETGVVVASTDRADLGFDLKEFPDSYSYLTNVRLGNNFSSDRVVRQISTGKVKKFAYMPTPDHRYLLELSLDAETIGSFNNDYSLTNTVNGIAALNPNIAGLRIFDSTGKQLKDRKIVTEPADKTFILNTIFPQRRTIERTNETNGDRVRYLFIDLKDPNYASDPSIVVELTYTPANRAQNLADTLRQNLMYAIIIMLLIVPVSFVITRQLNRPIREIADDVAIISKGDLDHVIRPTRAKEFHALEQGINTMVTRLKDTIRNLQESEEKVRDYNIDLENRVEERTEDLKEANKRADLYMNILLHDINNANGLALGFLSVLENNLTGRDEDLARKAMSGIEKSASIIKNISTIYRIQKDIVDLKPVNLDNVIRDEIAHYPGLPIYFEGTPSIVIADDLITEIFTNLIANSIQHGGHHVTINIRVVEENGDVLIIYEDNGKGISPDIQAKMFTPAWRKTGSVTAKGLGLFICSELARRYGGTIRFEERIPNHWEAGSRFVITLKKTYMPSPGLK